MPSFDIVSEIDKHEVRNAIENAERELSTRYDFRGVEASIDWVEPNAVLKAEAEFQIQQLRDLLRTKLIKRGVDIEAMDSSNIEHSGKTFNQKIAFEDGIPTDVAKKIVKLIKEQKIKVQTAIQGDQLRVTGKKRDDLQAVIALVKEANLGQAFQYKNFRD